MRSITTLSGALAGLMMILVGGMIPAALIIPRSDLQNNILSLPSSWQVPSVLICALICGAKSGLIAVIAYITIGLVYLPIFHGGGSIGYLVTPDFGYIAGFIPAAFITGHLARRVVKNDLLQLTLCAITGLILLHFCGILNLIIGTILNRWPESFLELIIAYTLSPLPSQVILCPGIGLIAIAMRRILFVE